MHAGFAVSDDRYVDGGPCLEQARVLKLNAWAASAPDFVDQPTVIDGASHLLIDVLGDHGRHARTALPTQALPQGALVELDATVAVLG